MLKIISERHAVENVNYVKYFESKNEKNSGYRFDCDDNLNLVFDNSYAKENYDYCVSHPDEYIDNGIIPERWSYIEPTIGICHCGCKLHLYNDTECDCGQWYNIFGQELVPPEYWHEDYEFDCDY